MRRRSAALVCLLAGTLGASTVEARQIGKTDERRPPTGEERPRFQAVGAVLRLDAYGREGGTGTVALSRRIVVTAAHLFVDRGQWRLTAKDGSADFSPFAFQLDACGRSYAIERVDVGTMDPDLSRERDFAVITLGEPVCSAVLPLSVTALGRDSYDALHDQPNALASAGYYQPSTLGLEGAVGPLPGLSGDVEHFELFVDDCALGGIERRESGALYLHDCDTEAGGSGGPLIAHLPAGDMLVGVHVAYSDFRRLNTAARADENFLALIDAALARLDQP